LLKEAAVTCQNDHVKERKISETEKKVKAKRCVYSDAGVDASCEEWTASYAKSYPLCNVGYSCTAQ
jgi:hypothetical protein